MSDVGVDRPDRIASLRGRAAPPQQGRPQPGRVRLGGVGGEGPVAQRQGSIRATQWKGGGKPFGPTPHRYDSAMVVPQQALRYTEDGFVAYVAVETEQGGTKIR